MIIFIRKSNLVLMLVFCILSVFVYNVYTRPEAVETLALPVASKVIVVDAGHGGRDPGKIASKTKKPEKEINLDIALKLQSLLEQAGAIVVMTRVEDEGLEGNAPKGSRKNAELRNRRIITNESQADILVSIHQNSYPDPSCKGAQVFYYGNSNESKLLAKLIQDKMVQYIDPTNHRKFKSNTSYAMLKNTNIPAVIIECGFISNPKEEALLNDPKHQQKIAEAIYAGTKSYFIELQQIHKGVKTFRAFLGNEAYFPPSDRK